MDEIETPTPEPAAPEGTVEAPQVDADEPDTFPRSVVQDLRKEAAERRKAATDATKRAEDLARQLHQERVKADGRLADPADLPYDEGHLTDPDKLNADIATLLQSKPHYASRIPQPGSSIAQGVKGLPPEQKAPGLLTLMQSALAGKM
jgi:hypothetical protein